MTTPVDWDFAQRVAERFSRREQATDAYHHETLVADFHELTAEAEQLVAAETGLVSNAGPARARVADRSMWIGANIASFQRLLRPLTDKMAEKFDKQGPLAGLTRRAGGAEVGIVLGWMSTRVLGQYDLLIIEEERPDDQDIVYYVGPNILALERKHGFPPREFRLWLALHETTHRAQFTGVPWLRGYFLSLVEETLDEIDPDPQRLLDAAKKILEARRRGEDALDGGLAVLLATERQREVLDRISGMMSLLEGHGDVTMDRAGEGRVPNAERFASVLRRRRNSARGVSRLFQKLIGIEAKLNQYAAGEAFIAAVEEAGGPELLNRAWEGPENLPSMSEIREPALWIERIRTGADPAALAG